MGISIVKRKLSQQESVVLAAETKKSPHIGYIAPHIWKNFNHVFVATNGQELLGVCVVVPLRNYMKIGPIIVLSEHQGKHVGSRLLDRVAKAYRNHSLYIGSSNSRVQHVVERLGFSQVSYWQLPLQIKLYLLSYLWQRGNIDYILDSLTKIARHRRGKYHFYLRHPLP